MPDEPVSYTYVPNLVNEDEELLFKCGVKGCGEETYVSALRTHAIREHDTQLYVTNMTTVKDDKRFTIRN